MALAMNSVNKPLYTYRPLTGDTCTRVIELQPAQSASDPLRCGLVEIKLDNSPVYEALSYTWGPANFSHELEVDGAILKITASLYSALKAIRLQSAIRHVWADAVCIDQGNNAEKSKQIPLMSTIYRNAACVLIWLGYGDEATTESIKALGRNVQGLSAIQWNGGGSDLSANQDQFLALVRPLVDQVVGLPWFSRRWIIQEVALNPDVTVLYHDQSMSFTRLSVVVRQIVAIQQGACSPSIHSVNSIARLWQSMTFEGKGVRIEDILSEYDHFACADSRDRLFAILGLATDAPAIRTDYAKTTEEVYNEFAGAYLTANPSYEGLTWLFGQAEARRSSSRKRANNLLSWAPDWRIPISRHTATNLSMGLEHKYKTFVKAVRADSDNLTISEFLLSQSRPRHPDGRPLSPDDFMSFESSKPHDYLKVDWASDPFPQAGGWDDVVAWLEGIFGILEQRFMVPSGEAGNVHKRKRRIEPVQCALYLVKALLEAQSIDKNTGHVILPNHCTSLSWPLPNSLDEPILRYGGMEFGVNVFSFMDIFEKVVFRSHSVDRSFSVALVQAALKHQRLFVCATSGDEYDPMLLGLGSQAVEVGDRVVVANYPNENRPMVPAVRAMTYHVLPSLDNHFVYLIRKSSQRQSAWEFVGSANLTFGIQGHRNTFISHAKWLLPAEEGLLRDEIILV